MNKGAKEESIKKLWLIPGMHILNVFQAYSGLPHGVYILFIARIVNRMGDFVHMFLTLLLSINMGLDKKTIAFYIMLIGLSRMIGSLISGKLGDHVGRKKIMVLSLIIYALLLIPCGFYYDSLLIIPFLVVAGIFNGAERPLNSAIVTDLTDSESRPKAFSLLYLGINFGVAVGPLIAGFLFNNYIQWIFWGDTISCIIAAMLIIKYVPETLPSQDDIDASSEEISNQERAESGNSISVFLKRPNLVIFTALTAMATFIYSQHSFVIPLQMEQFFSGRGAEYFGYLMSFNAVTVLLFTTIMLYLTKKNSPIFNSALATSFYGVGFGMLYFCYQLPLFFISTFFWTLD